MGKNVIVACDFSSKEQLESFLDSIEEVDEEIYCKVGMELFDSSAFDGYNAVELIKSRGHKVFLDLKLKDIPNTVYSTVKSLARYGVDMINIHADGASEMIKKAASAIDEVFEELKKEYDVAELVGDKETASKLQEKLNNRPVLLGVTVLTSMTDEALQKEIGVNKTAMEQVVSLAKLCKENGCGGVVCSPQEIMAVREACGDDFVIVTPGIRFADSKKDDQNRVATPSCANIMGSDYIVVGRPITKAEDKVAAYKRCKKDFTEEVTDAFEIENARAYIANLKAKVLSPSDDTALKLLSSEAFKVNTEDPFLLKSGIGAPIYCNCRDLYKHPAEQKAIMDNLAKLVHEFYPDVEAIYGTAMSAIGYGALIAERLGLPTGFVREQAKDHGIASVIEGPIWDGIKIVQIEDLITTGESSLKPIQALKGSGANVLGVAAIVDNFAPSVKLIENNIEYHTLTTMGDICKYASEAGLITEDDYKKVAMYMANTTDESWMSEEAKEKIAAKRALRKN